MNWELILQVTAPTFLVMAWFYNKIDNRMEKIEASINSIDRRLSHLEGRFEERGYWESRKTGTEQQK